MARECKFGGCFFAAALCAWGVLFCAHAQSPGTDGFDALMKQGFQLHQQARFAEAIPVFERARKMEPGDYFANLLLGIDLLRAGKAAEAVPRLQLAARAKPGEEFPEDYLGEAQATLGHYGSAAEAYQQAVLRGHGSEQSLEAWAGFALERFRQIGEELRASEQGISVARRLQEASSKPGAESSCRASIPDLERKLAIKQMRMDGESVFRLSICYAFEAGKAASKLQSSAEDAASVHRLRGDVLLRLKGDAAAAQAEYKEAIALHAGDPALIERLAEAQLSAGDTDAARQSARAALAIDPHRREAMRTLAVLAMSSREYDQAVPWLRQLAAGAPGDRAIAVELGRALAQTGESAEALRLLGPALAAGYPDEKGALHALLARVLRKLGRNAEATQAEIEARRLSNASEANSSERVRERPDANE